MDIINIKFDQTDAEIGSLGMQGENKKVALHVDCSGVLEKHPDAAILINYDRRFPGESYYNLPVTALENGIYEAVLTPMEMAYDGLKRIQVRAVEGDYEDRSKTFIAYVEKSVYDFRPPAGPVSDWLDQLQKALNQAEEAQQHGPVIGANGNWHVWQDGYYADTGVAAGSDISPEQIGEAVSDYLQQNPFQETDPTVPAWAKQPEKPSYTAQEVGAQPAGNYLTAETDPTVPDWAKAASKPSYTAAEVGALPSSTQIPKALSDLTQDTAHRTVTDAEKAAWNGKSNFSGSYNDLTDKPTIPDAYTLPIANASTLGGVKPVAKTDDMTQAVGVDALGALFTIPGGESGGSGDTSTMQEVVLASGTIPTGTAQWSKTDTGLKVSDLQEWKVWGFRYIGSDNGSYGVNVIGTTQTLLHFNGVKGQAIFGWHDSERKAIKILDAVVGGGYEAIGQPFLRNGIGIEARQTYTPYAYIPYFDKSDASVMFYNHSTLTADLQWEIRGVIK